MRVLIGLTPAACCEILNLARREFDDALGSAFLELPDLNSV
jgi:hypothetical protein